MDVFLTRFNLNDHIKNISPHDSGCLLLGKKKSKYFFLYCDSLIQRDAKRTQEIQADECNMIWVIKGISTMKCYGILIFSNNILEGRTASICRDHCPVCEGFLSHSGSQYNELE